MPILASMAEPGMRARMTHLGCTRIVYTRGMLAVVSVPVTTRLDSSAVEALDRAVAAGLGASRAAVISTAVHEWLATHGEDAIAASYRHRYAEADRGRDEVISRLASFSVAACLASDER